MNRPKILATKNELFDKGKEVLENAMSYTKSLCHKITEDLSESHDALEKRLDKIEKTLDINDIYPPLEEIIDNGAYAHNNAEEVQTKFSKAFMQGILDQCDIDDCDGAEIIIYKHGKRVRSYNYDKT